MYYKLKNYNSFHDKHHEEMHALKNKIERKIFFDNNNHNTKTSSDLCYELSVVQRNLSYLYF